MPYYRKRRSYYKKRSYKPRASSSTRLSRRTKRFVNELARDSKAGPYLPLTSPLEGYTRALTNFHVGQLSGTGENLGNTFTMVLNSILSPNPNSVGIKAYGISDLFSPTNYSRLVVTGYRVEFSLINYGIMPATLWIRRYIGTPATIMPSDVTEALDLQEEARSGQFKRVDLGAAGASNGVKTFTITGSPAQDWGLNDIEWNSNTSAQEAITSSSTTPVATSHQIRMSFATSRVPGVTAEIAGISVSVKLYQTVRLFRQEADFVIE